MGMSAAVEGKVNGERRYRCARWKDVCEGVANGRHFFSLIIQKLRLRNSFYQTTVSARLLLNPVDYATNLSKSHFSLFVSVLNGYSSVPIALCRDLDIRLNTAVKKIKYFDGGVEVTSENLKTNNSQVVHKGEKAISIWEKRCARRSYRGSASLNRLRRENDENIKDAWLIKIISAGESLRSILPSSSLQASLSVFFMFRIF